MIRAETHLAGRYRLDGRIAVGGMGEVWRGTDLILGRPVAVKLLQQADGRGTADAAARFRAEARHVGSLSHPGIAQVYDYCEAEHGYPPFLVMELVEGPSLGALLSGGPLDPVRTMDIIAQAALALHEAHAAGLVHRDIKPANLLLGPGDQVKIIDFGIAQTARSAEVTGTGAVIGSPAYLAPERVRGGPATVASDLYSLGIVAYECLAGAPPFSGTGMEIAHAHVRAPMPRLPAAVPPDLTAFVEHLTAKDPAARPPGAAEVARRARCLRDTLRTSRTLQLPVLADDWASSGSPDGRAPADDSRRHWAPGEHNPTMLDLAATQTPARGTAVGPRRLRGSPTAWPAVALVVIGIAVLAGLIGWQLKGVFDAGPGHQVAASPPAGARTISPPTGTVTVAASALVGQPVGTVRRELRQLGLQPRVSWQQSDQQEPGTVLAVSPTGPVQPGTVVVLTVATSRHSHDHGNGGGGDGNTGGH